MYNLVFTKNIFDRIVHEKQAKNRDCFDTSGTISAHLTINALNAFVICLIAYKVCVCLHFRSFCPYNLTNLNIT